MMVIDIDACGSVQAMHRENVLSLGFLGKQEIVRATDIRFDAETQKWGIWPAEYVPALARVANRVDGFYPPPTEHADDFETYEGARDVEVKWLEQARLVGVEPTSDSGLLILEFVRISPQVPGKGD